MTQDEKCAALREVEALAIQANEEGMPLSPLLVLAVCEGRFHVTEKARPLSHDRPEISAG
jgi:hypothetical protein